MQTQLNPTYIKYTIKYVNIKSSEVKIAFIIARKEIM